MNDPASLVASPTQDERTMATLAHVLQLVGSWIAPLIIFLTRRDSRFVSFHALQALLLQIAHLILLMVFVSMWFCSFGFLIFTQATTKNATPPAAFFVMFPLIWLGFMAMWVTILVIGIIYGIKAGHGEWAEYPLLGRLARKLLKMGPGGTELAAPAA